MTNKKLAEGKTGRNLMKQVLAFDVFKHNSTVKKGINCTLAQLEYETNFR